MFDIMQGFLPWILYFIFSDPERVLLGAGLGLGSVLLFRWKGLAGKMVLDWATLIYFLGLLVAIKMGGADAVARYGFVAAGVTHSLTTLGSVALGIPFTLQYARESVPPEHQNSPIFRRVNVILSSVWGGTFVFQTVLSWLYLEKIGSASLMNEILPNVLTVSAVLFTSRFPDWYVQRETKKQQA